MTEMGRHRRRWLSLTKAALPILMFALVVWWLLGERPAFLAYRGGFADSVTTGVTNTATGLVAGLGLLIALVVAGSLYLLPTIIAFKTKHHNAASIAIVNIFLGWTLIGWVVCLAWALSPSVAVKVDAERPMPAAQSQLKRCPYCAEEVRVEAIKCRYCGSELGLH